MQNTQKPFSEISISTVSEFTKPSCTTSKTIHYGNKIEKFKIFLQKPKNTGGNDWDVALSIHGIDEADAKSRIPRSFTGWKILFTRKA